MVSIRFTGVFGAFIVSLSLAVSPATAEPADISPAPQASTHERVIGIPGDPERPVTLQVTVMTPDGPGPFPLAVMNHGATAGIPTALQPRYYHTLSAYYFLSRGYAVVLPMMRGYARSGGRAEHHGCDVEATGLANARDIRAVIAFMAQQPDIDGSRVVVAGQSFGGWNTLALGALDVPGVKGLVSFAGGVRPTKCATADADLIAAAGRLGARTTLPSIWFFGDNDGIFPQATWRGMYKAYSEAGGRAELVAYGAFMTNSHNLLGYPEGLRIWTPRLDRFLGEHGLPATQVHPEYLPVAPPPPTGFAAIDDVDAAPYLNRTARGRDLYRRFLSKPFPRAIAIAPTAASSFNGGFDPISRALAACGRRAPDCRLYAVDDDVVWVGSRN